MTEVDTVTLTRSEYEALIARTEELEDALAARIADDAAGSLTRWRWRSWVASGLSWRSGDITA